MFQRKTIFTGCTARYNQDQQDATPDEHAVKKRDVQSVQKRSILGQVRNRRSAIRNIRRRDIPNHIKIQDSDGNPISKFRPSVEAIFKKHGKTLKDQHAIVISIMSPA